MKSIRMTYPGIQKLSGWLKQLRVAVTLLTFRSAKSLAVLTEGWMSGRQAHLAGSSFMAIQPAISVHQIKGTRP